MKNLKYFVTTQFCLIVLVTTSLQAGSSKSLIFAKDIKKEQINLMK